MSVFLVKNLRESHVFYAQASGDSLLTFDLERFDGFIRSRGGYCDPTKPSCVPNDSSMWHEYFFVGRLARLGVARDRHYSLTAIGGTFDRLHKGHKALIRKAFEIGERVVIGLSSDELVRSAPKRHGIGSYEQRYRELTCFLEREGFASRGSIVALKDRYGDVASDPSFAALVVSEETLANGRRINEMRASKGLPPVAIICVDLILADDGKQISTTRIREGHITPCGSVRK